MSNVFNGNDENIKNPYLGVLSASDFSTDIYPSINNAIASGGGGSTPQPYSGTWIATDFESQTQNSFNDTLQKIDNFRPSSLRQTNINGKLDLDDDITANKFIVQGGTNIQYLLADGSTLTQSANSGNSNFYLYTSINTSYAPPITAGNVEYNNANQSLATIVYISHLTRDNIDVDIFLQNISTLNILYIQDQNDSQNFIRYDITGTPTMFVNNYLQIPVSIITSSGTGSSTFGNNHNILVSFFANNQEINTRLSQLETKTINQSSTALTTLFSGNVNIQGSKIINVGTPTLTTDATNKLYVDDAITTSVSAIKQKGYPFNPILNGTAAITTGSKSYFYTIIINRPLTISGFNIYI